jgi:Zn-finger protein
MFTVKKSQHTQHVMKIPVSRAQRKSHIAVHPEESDCHECFCPLKILCNDMYIVYIYINGQSDTPEA